MKILILTNISVIWFYEYIRIYQKILVDILIQNIGVIEIDKEKKNLIEMLGKTLKMIEK